MSKCGDLIANKYILLKFLGRGTFAHVWMCYNVMNYKYYAIKIQDCDYYENGMKEVNLYKKIKDIKSPYLNNLSDNFTLQNEDGKNICMVFKLMAGSLYDIMKNTKYIDGYPISFVGKVTFQVLKGLDEFHNKLHLMHTDIKPENILLCGSYGAIKIIIDEINKHNLSQQPIATKLKRSGRTKVNKEQIQKTINTIRHITSKHGGNSDEYNNESSDEDDGYSTTSDIESDHMYKINRSVISSIDENDEHDEHIMHEIDEKYIQFPVIKLSDFGNSKPINFKKKDEVQTRYYRSPEIILRGEYNESNDIWALGCTIYELLTGKILFDPEKHTGISRDKSHLIEIQKVCGPIPEHITNTYRKKMIFYKKNGLIKGLNRLEQKPIKILIKENIKFPIDEQELDELCDFLRHLFDYDIRTRYDTKQCLNHNWIKKYGLSI